MSLWNLVNPSDPYTFETDDHEVAALVTLILGGGQYGAEEMGGSERRAPICFSRAAQWFADTFGRAIEDAVDAQKDAVVLALESVLIGRAADRESMARVFAAITKEADREAAKAAYHNERRSSMNDIGKRAAAWAQRLRGADAVAERAPQQVFG